MDNTKGTDAATSPTNSTNENAEVVQPHHERPPPPPPPGVTPSEKEPGVTDVNTTTIIEDVIPNVSPADRYVTGLKLVMLFSALTAVNFLMMLDISIISTAVPRITDEFHSLQDIGWYASIYQLASAALQPLTGKLYQKFSTRWTFLAFFGIFEVGSLVCGAANSSAMLIAGRAIAGMGASGLMNGGLTIIATAVPLERRPSLTGIVIGVSQLGLISGPLLGGAFTSYATWRWCFFVNLPIGALAFAALLLVDVPDHTDKPNPREVVRRLHVELDLVGFALLAPAAVQLLLGLAWGGHDYAWNSPTIIGLFCGSIGTFLVWIAWEWYRGQSALIPLGLVKQTIVWSSAITQTCILGVVFLSSFFLPLYFQAAKGATPIMSGVYVLPSILSQLLAAVTAGLLIERTGYVIPYALFSGMVGAISNGLYSTFTADTPSHQWTGYQILAGWGRGIGLQTPILAVQAALKPADIAIGMSLLVFFQNMGAAILLAAADTIFDTTLRNQIEMVAPSAGVDAIINAGATHFRFLVTPEELPAVLAAYATSVSRVFLLPVAISSLAVFTSLFMGWTDIRKKPGPKQISSTADPEQGVEKGLRLQQESKA
ncbi:putative multidrug efflux system protein [Podospora australis]|uniref:Multidrug efflux system protein n=1 Tax=Podospora australis TaxID=1536484 RepID=A0AAN7AIP5_9PEZI|nr:putative multidrug efflux system protein [Podospora australis]